MSPSPIRLTMSRLSYIISARGDRLIRRTFQYYPPSPCDAPDHGDLLHLEALERGNPEHP